MGVLASAALWERWNMVGTDGCFWPALYRVRTFRGVWAKLVRKPFVRSAHVFCCIVSLHRCNGKRLPKAHPTVAREAPERPDRASTFRAGRTGTRPTESPGSSRPAGCTAFCAEIPKNTMRTCGTGPGPTEGPGSSRPHGSTPLFDRIHKMATRGPRNALTKNKNKY